MLKASGQSVLRVATSGDYPPFSIALSTGYCGFDIDLVRKLAASLERQVEFVPFAWANFAALLSSPESKEPPFDMVASGITITPDRQRFGLFSQPYIRNKAMMLAAKTAGNIAPELRRIGVNKGGYLETLVRRAFPKNPVVTTDQNLKLTRLLDTEADCIVTDAIEGAVLAKKEALRVVAEMDEHEVALFFPRQRMQLCIEADVLLTSMRTDGTLSSIAQRNGIATALVAPP